MQYFHIIWKHTFPDEPVDLYIEVDQQNHEIRKIEIFPNGKIGYASLSKSNYLTKLSLEPIPPIEEIVQDSQFKSENLSKKDFEKIWSSINKH